MLLAGLVGIAAGLVALFMPALTALVLLARKLQRNARGTRVTLGDRLIVPWRRVLAANGVGVGCLTSRTLNRVEEVVAAAAPFERAASQ